MAFFTHHYSPCSELSSQHTKLHHLDGGCLLFYGLPIFDAIHCEAVNSLYISVQLTDAALTVFLPVCTGVDGCPFVAEFIRVCGLD
jgi:hypothetical protein